MYTLKGLFGWVWVYYPCEVTVLSCHTSRWKVHVMCRRCIICCCPCPACIFCFVGLLSHPVCLINQGRCTTRPSQPEPLLGVGWPSPLCSRNQSGHRQSFEGWSRDTAQCSQCTADKPHSCPAVHLKGVWKHSCPCCAARRLPSVPSVPNADFPDTAAALTWTCLCKDTRGSWACTAGRPLGCRWWRTWRRRRQGRMHRVGPALHLQKQPTWPQQRTGSKQRGSPCTLRLTAVEKKHSHMHSWPHTFMML